MQVQIVSLLRTRFGDLLAILNSGWGCLDRLNSGVASQKNDESDGNAIRMTVIGKIVGHVFVSR